MGGLVRKCGMCGVRGVVGLGINEVVVVIEMVQFPPKTGNKQTHNKKL